ncbi:hypothetical protein [Bacillus cereus]|uniref:YopA central domain-containing protein n=1 Tax=Bacillus cereus TIAC219 TaxID=718222 RepID=A0ABC9SV30_BACCE|nr:hypothetical protein [Bacillus cereus]EJP85991.1 hypothetical protein IC1_04409 [Bacillus cereus VD022]EOQ59745.1 hypothetical protein IAY_03936 [Bacillus cereus TIAC219]
MKDKFYVDVLNEKLFNIYEGEIVYQSQEELIPIYSKIILQNSPYPQILLNTDIPMSLKVGMDSFPHGYGIRTMKNHMMNISGSECSYNEDILEGFTMYLNGIKTDDKEVDEVVFFIMNCSHIGLTIYEETEYEFVHDDWLIKFKFRPDKNIENHYDNLRKNRGNEITHVGSISKRDKTCFNTEEIEEILFILEWYLSFCSAQSVSIPIQIGFKNESKVWENYVIKDNTMKHFQDSYGWVPKGGVDAFNKFFSNVATKLKQELWKDVLQIALNWYLEIKGNGMIENKIISTQIALEQLAWTYLVNQEQMLDKEGYKKLRATDILKLFCYQLNISKEIIYERLLDEDIVKKYQKDGVFMFVDFRNNLVHPDKKMNVHQLDVNTQAIVYEQGVYFLERALTGIFGYEGKYRKKMY